MHIAARIDFQRQQANVERIQQPTLVAWATDDGFVEDAISQELADRLPPGPRMRFDSGGHYIQKTQSVEIAEALAHWAKTTLFPDTVSA